MAPRAARFWQLLNRLRQMPPGGTLARVRFRHGVTLGLINVSHICSYSEHTHIGPSGVTTPSRWVTILHITFKVVGIIIIFSVAMSLTSGIATTEAMGR